MNARAAVRQERARVLAILDAVLATLGTTHGPVAMVTAIVRAVRKDVASGHRPASEGVTP